MVPQKRPFLQRNRQDVTYRLYLRKRCPRAHGTDRAALTPVAAPRRQKTRKTPTPPKTQAPNRCLGKTAARTPPTARTAPPVPASIWALVGACGHGGGAAGVDHPVRSDAE